MFEKFMEEWRRKMKKAWTDTGDGSQYPEGADNSQHSGDFTSIDEIQGEQLDAQIEELEAQLEILKDKRTGENRHVHQWQRGELPGGVKVRTCKCGATEKV